MCDACPKTKHLPVYTVSVFTGRRLCLCLDCADNRAEPWQDVVRGVDAGALDHLPRTLKDNVRLWTPEGYVSIYRTDKHLKLRLALPAPDLQEDATYEKLQEALAVAKANLSLPYKSNGLARRLLQLAVRLSRFLRARLRPAGWATPALQP